MRRPQKRPCESSWALWEGESWSISATEPTAPTKNYQNKKYLWPLWKFIKHLKCIKQDNSYTISNIKKESYKKTNSIKLFLPCFVNTVSSELNTNNDDSDDSHNKKKLKKKNKKMKIPTVSIAVPGSIIDNVPTLELATRVLSIQDPPFSIFSIFPSFFH